jgi:hypothetical protein
MTVLNLFTMLFFTTTGTRHVYIAHAYLNCLAQVLSRSLALDDRLVDFAGGDVVVRAQLYRCRVAVVKLWAREEESEAHTQARFWMHDTSVLLQCG